MNKQKTKQIIQHKSALRTKTKIRGLLTPSHKKISCRAKSNNELLQT